MVWVLTTLTLIQRHGAPVAHFLGKYYSEHNKMTFKNLKNKINNTLYKGIYLSENFADFPRSQKGATMIEYILMVALIAVAAVVAMKLLGTNLSAKFSYIANCISTASSC